MDAIRDAPVARDEHLDVLLRNRESPAYVDAGQLTGRDERPDLEGGEGPALPLLHPGGQEPRVEPAEGPAHLADAFAESIEDAAVDRQRDNYLETRVAASVLPTKLLRLSDTARLTLEEQGVATLFLALGFLRFYEAENSDVERRAPLLLVPAVLEREGRDRWRIRLRDDDPIVNPALVEYLREQHGISLPELPESLDGFSPISWYREVQRLVAGKPRWRVSADCIVGINVNWLAIGRP